MPSTRSTMTAHDHRTLGPPIMGAVAAVALGSYLLPGLAGAWPALRAPLGVDDRTLSGTGYALTFDDGPHAQGTPAVLQLLASADVSATFCLGGEQVQRTPSLARESSAA